MAEEEQRLKNEGFKDGQEYMRIIKDAHIKGNALFSIYSMMISRENRDFIETEVSKYKIWKEEALRRLHELQEKYGADCVKFDENLFMHADKACSVLSTLLASQKLLENRV